MPRRARLSVVRKYLYTRTVFSEIVRGTRESSSCGTIIHTRTRIVVSSGVCVHTYVRKIPFRLRVLAVPDDDDNRPEKTTGTVGTATTSFLSQLVSSETTRSYPRKPSKVAHTDSPPRNNIVNRIERVPFDRAERFDYPVSRKRDAKNVLVSRRCVVFICFFFL